MCYLREACLNSGGLRVKLSCMDSSLGGKVMMKTLLAIPLKPLRSIK